MSISVRTADCSDIPALVDVYCSDVETWHHIKKDGRGPPCGYEELEGWERVRHGGEWMDRDALDRYWPRLGDWGITSLVAEIDGRVVGHLDVIATEEPFAGKFLYLDVLMVHREFRRRGVATSIIEHASKLARKLGIDSIIARPDEFDGPSGLLYRKAGFQPFEDLYEMELECNRTTAPGEVAVQSVSKRREAPNRTHEMVCGRYNCSAKMWRFLTDPIVLEGAPVGRNLLLSHIVDGEKFFSGLRSLTLWTPVSLTLWTPVGSLPSHLEPVINATEAIAKALGIGQLKTLTLSNYVKALSEAGLKVTKKSNEPLMKKRSRN